MNKQLVDQIQQALQAQQDTIERQKQMLAERDSDIAQLTRSLERLATTQTKQIQDLPTLYEQLKNTIAAQNEAQIGWESQRETSLNLMSSLASDLLELYNAHIGLTELLKNYQATLTPSTQIKEHTEQLESELDALQDSQRLIMSKQEILHEKQQELEKLLNK